MNAIMRALFYPCAGLAVLSYSGYTMAQQIQIPGSGSASQEIEASRPTPPPQRDPAPVIIQQDDRPMTLPTGETLQVNAFVLEGVEFIPEEDIQLVLEPYKGRALTIEQIEEAAGKVTELYRSRGYMVARAYIPRQDASKGVLTIRILVGKYGAFNINNQSLVRTSVLQSRFDRLKSGQAITRAELERTMLLASDLYGAQMPQLTISPGQEYGTSDFDVEVQAGRRASGYILGDNQGSRYTGHYRLSGGMDINSPLGLGDRFSIYGLISKDRGLLNGSLNYMLPLMDNGLKGYVDVYRTTYELGQDFKDLDATGSDTGLTLGLSYPVIRSQNQNLNIYGSFTAKRLNDDIGLLDEETRKRAYVGNIGMQHDMWSTVWGRDLYTNAGLSLTYGHLDFKDEWQRYQNKLGANTDGSFYHLNLSLQGNYALTEKFSFNLTFNAQKALGNKNLDGSEQMSISGANAVRAYREVTSGDNAFFLNGELRYQLPGVIPDLNHSIGLFAGTGRSYYENGSYVSSNGIRLSDVGIGYYANYRQRLMLRLQLAHAVGPVPDEVYDGGRTQLLAQLAVLF